MHNDASPASPAPTPPNLPAHLRRVIERLIRAFAPERIVLFGSYARATNHAGSDIDLLVVANLTGDPLFHQRHARLLTADCFPPVDVVLATPEEVAHVRTTRSLFLLSIVEMGIILYRRPAAAQYWIA